MQETINWHLAEQNLRKDAQQKLQSLKNEMRKRRRMALGILMIIIAIIANIIVMIR
jgi:hypothetical protein